MGYLQKLITDIELHDAEGIRTCFEHGISANSLYAGRPLLEELIGEYGRGVTFKSCVQVFVDYGVMADKALLAVLLDDATLLKALLDQDPGIIQKKYFLRCAFTPLLGCTLLHICAEFNHIQCACLLVSAGADVDAKAALDSFGFGGQTPIYHTVNQHNNCCQDVMDFLIGQSPDLRTTIPGLVWGNGYSWETFIPSVNPISYAMMGLLRQFQRDEKQIYENVQKLIKASYGIDYWPANIPNSYLTS